MSTAPHTHPALVDGPVYLDYNATTPVDPEVVDAIIAAAAGGRPDRRDWIRSY